MRKPKETDPLSGMRLMDKIVFQFHKEHAIDTPASLANINKNVLRAQIS
jgi:hypothetical protein